MNDMTIFPESALHGKDNRLKDNQQRFAVPQQSDRAASYSELFTIALVGELLAQPYESVWYWLVRQDHRDLFPRLPEYSRYHRIVRNAEPLWAELAQSLAAKEDEDWGIEVIDAKPLPIAKGRRWEWAKMPEASKGFSTMGMVWGFKLHAVVSLGGLFKRWAFVPAHEHQTATVEDLIHGNTLGDGAYVGTAVYCPRGARALPVRIGVRPSRENMKRQNPWPRALSKLRKRIETSFSSLVRSLHLHVVKGHRPPASAGTKGQVKTFWSLRARVNLKTAARNLMHSGVLG